MNQYGDAGEQVVEISFITEGDVYRLIVHSKLPSAERFEHWVFDEVLPSIRKHGVYMNDSILDQVIQHPEVIYTLAKELVAESSLRVSANSWMRHSPRQTTSTPL